MPNPGWIPVIGGGFDQVAGQNLNWAQFNANIEAQNLARAAAAEQARNEYLMRLATLQTNDTSRNIERQMAADQYQQGLAYQQAMNAIAQKNWQQELGLNRENLAMNRERIAAEDRRTNAQYGFANRQEQQSRDTIENFAKFAVEDLNKAATTKDDAQQAYVAAQRKLDTALAEKAAELPADIAWNPKTKQFDVLPTAARDAAKGPELFRQARQANIDIANIVADHTAAEMKFATGANDFDSLLANAQKNYGLTASRRDGKWVLFSPLHQKSWGPNSAAAAAPPTTPAAPEGFQPAFDVGNRLISPGTSPFFGFQAPSGVPMTLNGWPLQDEQNPSTVAPVATPRITFTPSVTNTPAAVATGRNRRTVGGFIVEE